MLFPGMESHKVHSGEFNAAVNFIASQIRKIRHVAFCCDRVMYLSLRSRFQNVAKCPQSDRPDHILATRWPCKVRWPTVCPVSRLLLRWTFHWIRMHSTSPSWSFLPLSDFFLLSAFSPSLSASSFAIRMGWGTTNVQKCHFPCLRPMSASTHGLTVRLGHQTKSHGRALLTHLIRQFAHRRVLRDLTFIICHFQTVAAQNWGSLSRQWCPGGSERGQGLRLWHWSENVRLEKESEIERSDWNLAVKDFRWETEHGIGVSAGTMLGEFGRDD
jgi:hypothetical protein